MYDIYCPRHRRRVLLGPRSIEAFVDTPNGVALHWKCRCGARGTLRLGRGSSPDCHDHRHFNPPIQTAA